MAMEAEGERLPVEQGQEQGEAEGVRVTLRVRVMLTVPDLLREAQEDWEGDRVRVLVTEGDRVTVSARVAGDTESVTDTVEESEPEGVPECTLPCTVPDTVTVLVTLELTLADAELLRLTWPPPGCTRARRIISQKIIPLPDLIAGERGSSFIWTREKIVYIY